MAKIAFHGLVLAAVFCVGSAPAHAQRSAASTKAATAEGLITVAEPADWNVDGQRGIVMSVRRSQRIKGTAEHPQGISTVLINGAQATLAPSQTGAGVGFAGYLTIDKDTRFAEVTAVTPTGVRFTRRYPVTPAAEAAPPATPHESFDSAAGTFKGRRYAVIVGVSKYSDSRIQSLQYADRDAKAFYDFLRSERAGLGGIPSENIRVLLNDDATFLNIRKALFDFLKVPTEDDIVYIYFAGHGSPDPDRRENLYLLPYDVDADNISSTAFPMEDVEKAVKRVYARHVVVIADACHSAGVAGDAGTRAALSLNEINARFVDRLEQSTGGTATFTASESNQLSLEDERWGGGHGVFTYFLIEALKGAADENRDQIVSLGEMMEWTRTRVLRETENAQIPRIAGRSFDRNWPMAVVLPGTDIPEITEAEMKAAAQVSNVMANAFDFPWKSADSLVAVVSVPDTITVTLQNESQDVLPSHRLSWGTTNSSVVQVDSFGVVYPMAPGNAAVTARGFNRKITVPIRVFDRPRQIVFTPSESDVDIVISERFDIRADLLVSTGQWIRGFTPKLTLPDTIILSRNADGSYTAMREGVTELTGNIAGTVKNWRVRIRPPLVRITQNAAALVLGDSMPMHALRTRHDGTVLGEALGVDWLSTDTSVLQVRGPNVYAKRVGRASIIAELGPYADTVAISVAGDLLVAIERQGNAALATVSIQTGESFVVGPDSIRPVDMSLSPDGQTIVFASGKDRRLYTMSIDGTGVQRLNVEYSGAVMRAGSYEEHNPRWTFDGKRIVFASNRPGNYEIFTVNPDGTDVQRLTESGAVDWHVNTAPDNARIVFERTVGAADGDVILAHADGTQQTAVSAHANVDVMRVSETRPALLGGGNLMLMARGAVGLDKRAGETLVLYDINKKVVVSELVKPMRDHELRYAVSPDARFIAYHQRATWGRKSSAISVINLNGELLKTLSLGKDVEIREISWGAIPLNAEKTK